MFYRQVYTQEILQNAADAAHVMHPNLIWPGLCKQLKRKPTMEEWNKVIAESPFVKKDKNTATA